MLKSYISREPQTLLRASPPPRALPLQIIPLREFYRTPSASSAYSARVLINNLCLRGLWAAGVGAGGEAGEVADAVAVGAAAAAYDVEEGFGE